MIPPEIALMQISRKVKRMVRHVMRLFFGIVLYVVKGLGQKFV